jgi:hypothetical protein
MSGFPIEDIDFSVVSHIVAGGPDVAANGSVCIRRGRHGHAPLYMLYKEGGA